MLRVETQESDGALMCRLEGRFTGEGAEQVRLFVTRCNTSLKLLIDLTEIIYIDAVGEEVLSFIRKLGARFLADTSYSRDICERLHLPLMSNHNSNKAVLGDSDDNRSRPIMVSADY